MNRGRSLLLGAVLLGAVAIPAAGAQTSSGPHAAACTDSWKAAVSGLWGVPSNWSTGQIPGNSDQVCITLPGTYTVTLAPWSIGTADPNNSGAGIDAITIGASGGSGTETLEVAGQGSTNNSNEQVSTVFLDVSQTSTITSHGNLILDSTSAGTKPPQGMAPGGAAGLGGDFLNYGTIETETQAPSDKLANFVQIEATLVNEPHASVRDLSGQLQADDITNYGDFTVAPGASMSLIPLQVDFGEPSSFANYGALVNGGSITAYQTAGTVIWTQAGGPIRGNEVVLGGGTVLIDKSGAAQFFVDSISAQVKGTIPFGQKITVVGEAYNYRGDNYNGTTLGMDASTVVNDGTIVLESQGSGTKTGGPAVLNNGAVVNNGTILAEVKDPSWPVQYEAGLANKHSGTLSVTGGEFEDNAPAAATNDGTVKVGSGSLYLLESAAAFTNKSDGTVVVDVSSPKSLGQFQVVSPCCVGPGKFIAGGTLDPVVVGHVPANTDLPLFLLSGGIFKGTFAHLAKSFTADYAHETATPAFVGAVYKESGKKP